MSPHPPIKPLKQALKDRFPTDSVFLTGQLREVVDEFSPHNVDSFRGDQTKYFNARVQKYCRRIWKGDWPSTVKESNELCRIVLQLVKARCYNRFLGPKGYRLRINGKILEKAQIEKTDKRLATGVDSSASEYEESSSSDSGGSDESRGGRKRVHRRRGIGRAQRRARLVQTRSRHTMQRRSIIQAPSNAAAADRASASAEVDRSSKALDERAAVHTADALTSGDSSAYRDSCDAGSLSQHERRNGYQSTRPTTHGELVAPFAIVQRTVESRDGPGSKRQVVSQPDSPGHDRASSRLTGANMQPIDSSAGRQSVNRVTSQSAEVRTPSAIIDKGLTQRMSSSRTRAAEWALHQKWIAKEGGGGYAHCAFGDHGPFTRHGFASSIEERDECVVAKCGGFLSYTSSSEEGLPAA